MCDTQCKEAGGGVGRGTHGVAVNRHHATRGVAFHVRGHAALLTAQPNLNREYMLYRVEYRIECTCPMSATPAHEMRFCLQLSSRSVRFARRAWHSRAKPASVRSLSASRSSTSAQFSRSIAPANAGAKANKGNGKHECKPNQPVQHGYGGVLGQQTDVRRCVVANTVAVYPQ